MCGEHHVGRDHAGRPGGSSPHVRGAQVQGRVPVQGQGIIPACAGSTGCRWPPAVRSWDHPRMCGEHHYLLNDDISSPGSSPHVRGAPTRSPPDAPASRDHPRMCGEHFSKARKDAAWWGSSPHVRGAPVCGKGFRVNHGIIPACAGSTDGRWRCQRLARDHPRMCGEHGGRAVVETRLLGIIPACAGSTRPSPSTTPSRTGSSPHVRGARGLPELR